MKKILLPILFLILAACSSSQVAVTRSAQVTVISSPPPTATLIPQPPEATPTYMVLEGTKNNSEFVTLFSGNTELVTFNAEHPVHKTETGWAFDEIKDFLLTPDGRGIVTMGPTLENQVYDHSASIVQSKVNGEGQTELWIGLEKYNLTKGEWEYNISPETVNFKDDCPHILSEDVANDNWGRSWEAIRRLILNKDGTWFADTFDPIWEVFTLPSTLDENVNYHGQTVLIPTKESQTIIGYIPAAAPRQGCVWINDQERVGIPLSIKFHATTADFLLSVPPEVKLDPFYGSIINLSDFRTLPIRLFPPSSSQQLSLIPGASYTETSRLDDFNQAIPEMFKHDDPSSIRRLQILNDIVSGTIDQKAIRKEFWVLARNFQPIQ